MALGGSRGALLFKDSLRCSKGCSSLLTVSESGCINEVSLSLLDTAQVSFFLTLPLVWRGGLRFIRWVDVAHSHWLLWALKL